MVVGYSCIHRAPETYARSDSCKKDKNFSRQADSFLEEKLQRLRRKTYEGKYDTRDKNLPVLANSSNHSRARCHDISVHSKHHILSLKSNGWRLKNISCHRNEPKQYTNTWQRLNEATCRIATEITSCHSSN